MNYMIKKALFNQKSILNTYSDSSIILIRIMVGAVFLAEGTQKFLYPVMRGVGRFEKMGFPNPDFFASFVGVFEVMAGLLLLLGLVTRVAAFTMLINMLVAIIVTKIPIAFGESFGPFVLRELKTYGFWSMAHEMRTDFAMGLGSLFLIIKGRGRWSLDLFLKSTNNSR